MRAISRWLSAAAGRLRRQLGGGRRTRPQRQSLPLKRLRPGAKASGKVLVGVPKNATLKTVRYEAGVLGPPLEVRAAR